MKVSELEGAELHYWVARALGYESPALETEACIRWSTDWNEGGPIIEREQISIINGGWDNGHQYAWQALKGLWLPDEASDIEGDAKQLGPTPLIAAMRCFVASRFGEVTPDRETT